MCGIAGIIGKVDLNISQMSDRIAHRGPDGSGFWSDESGLATLAHRRLAILDPEAGVQPMHSMNDQYVIVFNGEIYNFPELRRELELKGRKFQTHCDTEVILEGYAVYGLDIVRRLRGMFSFGLWDRCERKLVLARDRMGIKPLFYRIDPQGLAFASEAKALIDVRAELDCKVLVDYLRLGFRTVEGSLFKGVMELPPATTAVCHVFGGVSMDIQRYWQLPSPIAVGGTIEENAIHLHDVLTEASRMHLLSDVPLGFWLSGGLDSSIILRATKDVIPEDSRTALTLEYGLPNDETPYAKHMAEESGVRWKLFRGDLNQAGDILTDLVWHLEEPLPNVTALTTFALARWTKSQTKVVLIGEGSDELFAGYPTYIPFTGPWKYFPGSIKGWAAERSYLLPSRSGWKKLAVPDLAHEMDSITDIPLPHDLDGMLRFDLRHELIQSQLARIDKMTMAHGVEARVPFLDHQVVETAMQIPVWQKRSNGKTKMVLRKAFERELPEKILNRPKYGKRGTQGITGILYNTLVRKLACRLLTKERLAQVGCFRYEGIQRLLNGRSSIYYLEAKRQKTLYFLVLFDLWHRMFIEGVPRREVAGLIKDS